MSNQLEHFWQKVLVAKMPMPPFVWLHLNVCSIRVMQFLMSSLYHYVPSLYNIGVQGPHFGSFFNFYHTQK
jgi:hypothetical protein